MISLRTKIAMKKDQQKRVDVALDKLQQDNPKLAERIAKIKGSKDKYY